MLEKNPIDLGRGRRSANALLCNNVYVQEGIAFLVLVNTPRHSVLRPLGHRRGLSGNSQTYLLANVTAMVLFVFALITRQSEKDSREEILKAFRLFDDDETGKISFRNLKRVAKELGENMTDEELQVGSLHLSSKSSNGLCGTSMV